MGGIDVARRVFSPAMPLEPGLLDYESGLKSETGGMLFAWIIGLMPGTASVDLQSNHVTVHVIDRRAYDESDLRQMESRLAAVLDEPERPERH